MNDSDLGYDLDFYDPTKHSVKTEEEIFELDDIEVF